MGKKRLLMGVKGRSGRNPKYPWNDWLVKGKVTQLKKGREFDVYTRTFISMIYRKAAQYGVAVSIYQLSDDRLELTCLK